MRGFLTLLILTTAVPAFAQAPQSIDADRPGIADSSTVVGKGVLQIESGVQWEKHGGESLTLFPTLFRVGISRRFEARIESDTITTVIADDLHSTGLSPVAAGFKLVVLEGGDRKPNLGVITRLYPRSGTGLFHSAEVAGEVDLAGDLSLNDRWSIESEAGVGWYSDDPGRPATAMLSATLSYDPSPKLEWFADAGSEIPEVPGGLVGVTVDAGVVFFPKRNWQVDLSAGTRVHGDTGPRPFVSVGFAYRVGR